MNELFPRSGVPVEPGHAARAGRPTEIGAPTRWVAINMVVSIDGAIAIDGRSGGLGGPADKAMFHALRDAADVVLVGAETTRAERYHRSTAGGPAIAVVSGSARFPDTVPLFDPAEPGEPPMLFTTATSASRLASEGWADGRGEVVVAASDPSGTGVSLTDVVETLVARGLPSILCEGGPGLLTQLAAADLVDEWNITLSPTLAGASDSHMVGHLDAAQRLRLDRVCEDDGMLLLRYGRSSSGMTNV